MSMLSFRPVGLEDIGNIYPYTAAFGEGSCQHSPVSMWSQWEKYGDQFCIEEDCLYVHRSGLASEGERTYLAPMGEGDPVKTYGRILEDAKAHGKRARFETLTDRQAALLGEAFPGRFEFRKERDLAEYIFSTETFLQFPGKLHARRRTELRSFWKAYGERARAEVLGEEDFEEVLAFAWHWLEVFSESHEGAVLLREFAMIEKQIAHYRQLELSGTVIRVDGAVRGFCYGAPLNDETYDVLIEKGDRQIQGIYRVIRQESARLNLEGFSWVNFEEDVGEPGLRKLKESYGPSFMIEKTIALER